MQQGSGAYECSSYASPLLSFGTPATSSSRWSCQLREREFPKPKTRGASIRSPQEPRTSARCSLTPKSTHIYDCRRDSSMPSPQPRAIMLPAQPHVTVGTDRSTGTAACVYTAATSCHAAFHPIAARRIMPSQSVADHEVDAADNPTIIDPRHAVRQWKHLDR